MTLRIIIGIILLLINVPVGWLGLTYFICYGKKTGKKIYYWVAFFVYAVSWGLLGLGVYLCGEKYSKIVLNDPIIKYVFPVILIGIIIYIVYNFKKKLAKPVSKNC
jgi:hypothetical protein